MAVSALAAPKTTPKRDWTVLFYMNGQGDADKRICQRMLDLEQLGSTDQVSLVTQVARLPQSNLERLEGSAYKPTKIDGDWTGVRRYLVAKSDQKTTDKFASPVIQDLGNTDMASGASLADFLAWGVQNYPAEHYAVVLCGHGGAWTGAMYEQSPDPTAPKNMPIKELDSALAVAATVAGQPIDNVDLMACGMSSAEFALQISEHAKFLAGSEEISYANSFPYNSVIAKLQEASRSQSPLSPRQLAETQVKEFQESGAFHTRSAIDLEKIPTLQEVLKEVSGAILAMDNPQRLKRDLEASQSFGKNYKHQTFARLRDLGEVARHFSEDSQASAELRDSAQRLAQAVDEATVSNYSKPYSRVDVLSTVKAENGETVTTQQVCAGEYKTHGLSVYAPTDLGQTEEAYSFTKLAQDTGWGLALNRILGNPQPGDRAAL